MIERVDFMLILGLNYIIDHLDMAAHVHWL